MIDLNALREAIMATPAGSGSGSEGYATKKALEEPKKLPCENLAEAEEIIRVKLARMPQRLALEYSKQYQMLLSLVKK